MSYTHKPYPMKAEGTKLTETFKKNYSPAANRPKPLTIFMINVKKTDLIILLTFLCTIDFFGKLVPL